MDIVEKVAEKTPDKIVKVLKKPVIIGRHHLRLLLSDVRCRLRPRRFQVYCLGLPRTGTTSIAGLFHRKYRARHEPDDIYTAEKIVKYIDGHLTREQLVTFVKRRDRSLWLELESSHFLYFYLDVLIKEFDQVKFILLMRDCYSWLNSYLNHQLGRPLTNKNDFWQKLRDIYFGKPFKHPPSEKVLAERGLYTLEGYLSCWKKYNEMVLTAVPREKLLIIRTMDINQSINQLGEFVGISPHDLDLARSHLNKKAKGFDLLAEIDQDYLKEKFDLNCKNIMMKYFPQLYKENYGIPIKK